jgi:hypothetical protein
VRIIYNSTRYPPSPAIPISALRISRPQPSFQRPASSLQNPWPLIANTRLEFGLSRRKISLLRISNRERMTIFHSALGFSLATRHLSLATAFLIANLELEFRVSPIRINKLKFSNRKFSGLLSSPRRTGSMRGTRSTCSPLVTHHPPLATSFLIVTPESKFPATRTKQNSSSIPNRYKTRLSRPGSTSGTRLRALHSSLITYHSVIPRATH